MTEPEHHITQPQQTRRKYAHPFRKLPLPEAGEFIEGCRAHPSMCRPHRTKERIVLQLWDRCRKKKKERITQERIAMHSKDRCKQKKKKQARKKFEKMKKRY